MALMPPVGIAHWNTAPSAKLDETAPGCGPAPAGMKMIPGSCMGNPSTCKGSACNCAANVQLKTGNCGALRGCFAAAQSACAADKKCKSFAVLGPPCSNYTAHLWQTYSVGSANAVKNTPWTTFAMHSDSPVEPPPPPPAPPPAPQWEPRSPCVDNTDCAMLGKCSAGKCSCSSGWTGPSCQTLDLLPADPVGAFGWAPNVSAWGAHVFKDKFGQYHMYAAELVSGMCRPSLLLALLTRWHVWCTVERLWHPELDAQLPHVRSSTLQALFLVQFTA